MRIASLFFLLLSLFLPASLPAQKRPGRPLPHRIFASSRVEIDRVLARPHDMAAPIYFAGETLYVTNPQGWAFNSGVQFRNKMDIPAFDLNIEVGGETFTIARADYMPSHIHIVGAPEKQTKASASSLSTTEHRATETFTLKGDKWITENDVLVSRLVVTNSATSSQPFSVRMASAMKNRGNSFAGETLLEGQPITVCASGWDGRDKRTSFHVSIPAGQTRTFTFACTIGRDVREAERKLRTVFKDRDPLKTHVRAYQTWFDTHVAYFASSDPQSILAYWQGGVDLKMDSPKQEKDHSSAVPLPADTVGIVLRRDEILEVDPQLDKEREDWFVLDGYIYREHDVTVAYDSRGEQFASGFKGFAVYVDGKTVYRGERPTRLLYDLATKRIVSDARSKKATLTVRMTGLRNSRGHVGVVLFAGPEGFPNGQDKALRKEIVTIDGDSKTATITFENLPSGEYAVAICHDENDNGRLDRNVFGIPTEGYGFSNNARASFGPPSFRASAFALAESKQILEIKVRY